MPSLPAGPLEVRTVSSTGGEKGAKLARFDLIPVEPWKLLAEHFGIGARKYADRNWERGYEWGKSYAALLRHLGDFWNGVDYDRHEEDCPTGCTDHTDDLHLAAVIWHAVALTEFFLKHPEFDDRPNSPITQERLTNPLIVVVPPGEHL